MKCPHCEKQGCYEHCSARNDGKHYPVMHEAMELHAVQDNGRLLVNFECRYCGQTGTASVEPNDINWV